MDLIRDRKVLNCIGESVPVTKAFKNKKLMLLYFSASWSPHCIKILPKLKKFYEECNKQGSFQFIYVSADDDPNVMLKHYKEKHSSGWYAFAVGDPSILELIIVHGITHVPTIVVVRVIDGLIVSKTGLEDILELGCDALIKWRTD